MIELFAVNDIEEGKSKGIDLDSFYMFAVKKDNQIHLYWNRCPHLGTPLEWQENDFLDTVAGQFSPEVVYLDPMFPRSKKNTLSKKPLNYLQKLLIEENDESLMLAMALEIATRRVVVKRGSHSQALGAGNIDFVFKGNSNRFDVYLT